MGCNILSFFDGLYYKVAYQEADELDTVSDAFSKKW